MIAVAGGPAFSFGYAETTELLAAAGARVRIVDPLRDEALPAGTRGLVVGGGFPEVYASELAANAPLRAEVAALAATGAPIAAECAGLLWLCRSLDGAPMCGVLDADATMTDRLTLGYRDAVALADSVLTPAGTRVTGHEFHRTAVLPARAPDGPGSGAAWAWRADGRASDRVGDRAWRADGRAGDRAGDGAGGPEGFVVGGVHASYLHLHWAGRPGIPRRMVVACG